MKSPSNPVHLSSGGGSNIPHLEPAGAEEFKVVFNNTVREPETFG